MRYTYKRTSGYLALLLGVMLISRFAPNWLYFSLLGIVSILLVYFVYYSSY